MYEPADSDDEADEVQSSLDVNSIARMSLKRRASDSYRAQLNVNGNHIKGRKGSLSPFVEVIVSKKVGLAFVYPHAITVCTQFHYAFDS